MTLQLPALSLLPQGITLSAHAFEVDELAEWLDALPADKPSELMRALLGELADQRQASLSQRTRLKLLDLVREKAEAMLPAVEEQLRRSPLPLPAPAQQTLVDANELLKQICAGYESVSDKMARRWYGIGTNRLLCSAVTHGLRLHQRRLKLAYRVYARGSRSAWTEMHALYHTAREAGIARLCADGASESPERLYIDALLLAFAEPAKFAAGDLDRVRFYIERYGRLARLEPLTDGGNRSAGFQIRRREAGPGQSLAKWRDGDLEPGAMVLRCDDLVKELETQLAGLEQGTAPARLGLPKLASEPHYQALLRNLARLWGAPPTRRFHRSRFRPRVDVIVGCAALRQFLAGAAYRRRAHDGPDQPVPVQDLTEWAVTNESADGLALRYLGGDPTEIQVGEVIGVRSRGASLVHVCIVRRAESVVTGLEVGVQVLASHALVASIALPRDGSGAARRSVEVMVLPRLPGADGAPALLAPPTGLVPGTEFATELDGRHWLMRVARRIEKTASCELFALEKAEAAPLLSGCG